ncbi:MAG: hypothetical protein H6925_04900 [Holosporaceae bacterium]|nr:MAG: hypothetical protein H6925_04900 [Holosporaceae bacterium]
MWFLFGIIVVSVASLWGTPHLLRSAPEEQAKQRVSTIDRISRLFLLRRRASKAPVTEAPWSVPVVRRNPLYGVHEADLGAGQRRFSADIDDRPVSFIGEDDDIRSDPKTMHAARLDVEEAPLDVPEERHREGNETPYGFGSLEDLRHVGDRPADLEEDREEDLEESQEEEEVLGFGDLHPATDEGVDASAAGKSPTQGTLQIDFPKQRVCSKQRR